MALPALLIHSAVHYTVKFTQKVGKYQKWLPSVVGLAMIPFLPVALDKPCEIGIEYGFHTLRHSLG